ncbi:exodeoxyribonuclease III [Mycolicibacterium aubagnense]|uniref:Exodeoxyribonuclease n=1 Tax=Mycolicibacterium aubagnense TaxID=319707 RepID=A0ABM7IBD4_9MYCO|nr:exodeoxyribonuclease III [Mycolicibacterium aubagnense]TLH58256.1 exodeoxyribonuclease III [Mycolicibacterium aubagnense]WGI34208.1 exodeoxyribonuclease III [Mycolicibacterium aubagnense]BBX83968.1 putative exodeoxyribonuclease [Mycolicibacterium aubagnense]
MIVTTINVNGIRAAVKERSEENLGLLPWLKDTTSDVICLQETRADDAQLAQALAPALDAGWHLASAEPHAKGRNGVAVLSRAPISAVRVGLSPDCEFVAHGRYLEADTDGVTVASVYVPTGEAETDKQVEKERFMVALAARMAELSRTRRDVVICGDWNICATELDLKAWKANVKKSGFLPSERQWLSELMASGWTDVVRELHPDVAGPYSWWSWRGKAFDNDAGWRIDYHLANAKLAPKAVAARVERAAAYALRWSDHAPVTVEYG